jgi:segregation and condensation protein A
MVTAQTYAIRLPVYEGPLDLLLELIEQAELDITKVALAEVTDQYLLYLEQIQEHQLEDLTSFLVIATRLLQIKSEALLPRPPLREPGEEDPGDALARQLIAYKKYKQVAIFLADRMKRGMRSYIRIATAPVPEPKLDLAEMTIDDLKAAMETALTLAPKKIDLEKVVSHSTIRIRDKVIMILGSLKETTRTTFQKLIKQASSKMDIVVSFIALLELIKQQRVAAHQESLFGDIEILRGDEWNEGQSLDFDLEFEE